MVNVFDDIIVICWVDCTLSEVGANHREEMSSEIFSIVIESCWETKEKE